MNRNRSRAVAVIALAAMTLRALLPDGWMPANSASAGSLLTICTMNGPVRVAMGDGQPQKQPAKHDSRSHETCPFAAAQHFAASVGLPSVAAPSLTTLSLYENVADADFRARDLYAPQSPRGPPAFG
ncbi:MAG TPA: DUF2946 family protein [Rhizomicrobium sp.]|jgi:hypothetical protein